MYYEVISTGSKGNCVIIENIMIDCGVPFKKIKEKLYDVDVLLLTHRHSDHIKESTLKNIVMMFPHIKIFSNYDVCQFFPEYPIAVVNKDKVFSCKNSQGLLMDFEPFQCIHDVLCYGYVFYTQYGRVIYATDTSDLRYAPSGKYDWFFIESNHDEKKVEQILHQQRQFGYNAYAGAKRHMSTQQCKAFYYMNRQSKDSVLVELHQSARFY